MRQAGRVSLGACSPARDGYGELVWSCCWGCGRHGCSLGPQIMPGVQGRPGLCSGKGPPGSGQVSQATSRRHAVHSAQGQSRRGRGGHRDGPWGASGAGLQRRPTPHWRRVSPGLTTPTCKEARGATVRGSQGFQRSQLPSEGPGWTHGHIPGRTPHRLSPDVAREPTLTSGDLVVEGDVGVLLHTLTRPEPRGPGGQPVA